MAKYRKKPVIIEAFQLGVDEEPQWWINAKLEKQVKVKQTIYYNRELTIATIKTLEGKMRAETGDYIIRGVKGELYPCKEDIFDKTYEKVED